MPLRTVNLGPSTGSLDLCFSLTHAQLKALENMRHLAGKNLYLRLDPIIVWNEHKGNSQGIAGGVSTLEEYGWDVNAGLFSEVAFFWLPSVGTLRLDVAAIDWAKKIFPGMGYDLFRLIEVKLPATNSLVPVEAVDHFKEAQYDYDRGLHRESLMKCRFALEEVEAHLPSRPQGHRIGSAITRVLGWPDTPRLTEQASFLDGAWLALYSMANASHHTPSTKSLLPSDAQIVLIQTAALLEYMGQLE